MDEQRPDYLSEDVQEILSMPPGWVATWGTSVILIVIFMIALVGWQFKYPDKLNGKLTLTTLEQPISVFADESGYLSEILVTDNQEVKKGDILAIFKNSAYLNDVLKLEKDVEKLSQYDLEAFQNYIPDPSLVLGEILNDYSNFQVILEDFSFSNSSDFDIKDVKGIYRQISEKERLIRSYRSKEKRVQKELETEKRRFKSARDIYSESNETKDYEKMEDALKRESEKASELESINLDIAKENDEITDLRKLIFEKQIDSKTNNNARFSLLKQRLTKLKSSIEAWKRAYLVTSPIDGKVSFYNSKTEQQFYQKGEEVMAIVPHQAENQYVGYINLPIQGSGKVKNGQEVLIKFDRFPFREFGHVKGVVENIALLPKNDAYEVKVQLTEGLKTNFGRDLEFRQMMSGTADIITGQERFVARLFQDFKGWFG